MPPGCLFVHPRFEAFIRGLFGGGLAALLLFISATIGLAHDGLDVEPPGSEPEAWNTILLAGANIEKLMAAQQWLEVPVQASFCSQAVRFLREHAGPSRAATSQKYFLAEEAALDLYSAASRNDGIRTGREFRTLAELVDAIQAQYDPKIVHAAVYACPMCRGVRDLDPKKTCFKCGMALVPRIIPASSIYNTPGEPSIILTPTLDHQLRAGEESKVVLKFTRKKDGEPINPADLLVVHTERIHLLIIDESLTDYHHEHPVPTGTPGEYSFPLKPRLPGAYRVFADVVPALSNVQEYAACDLPGDEPGQSSRPAPNAAQADVDGLHYSVVWESAGAPIRSRQAVRATVQIADSRSAEPFRKLEPIMGTFAHVVAFHEDRQTVLHIHPLGDLPQNADDRGGPAFTFQFYAPKPGLYHLFSQVQVGGVSRFAPFLINVVE